MLVFATSDKGGTGRSVTSCNVAYRRALQGSDVCYLDFDFGSPTSGAIFSVNSVVRGTDDRNGLHRYLQQTGDFEPRVEDGGPLRVDVWREQDGHGRRTGRPTGAGRLTLLPGDMSGGEFAGNADIVRRCIDLLLTLDEEYELCIVDLSAGRSHAIDIVLSATADDRMTAVKTRWLVFHRWTRQHVIAAEGLAFGRGGLIDVGKARGHPEQRLRESVRFIRTAVVDLRSPYMSLLSDQQRTWLAHIDRELLRLAREQGIGETTMLGQVPLDPLLQWREQVITDYDTQSLRIANQATVDAFETIARNLTDEAAWTPW